MFGAHRGLSDIRQDCCKSFVMRHLPPGHVVTDMPHESRFYYFLPKVFQITCQCEELCEMKEQVVTLSER